MAFGKGRLKVTAIAAAACLTLAACGASPTDTNGGGKATTSKQLAAVYKAVDGLTGTARYDKLLAMAKKEGGKIGFYHSGDLSSEVKAFEKQTGLKVADFQATSERAMERVNQENKAGRPGSDVVIGASGDMVALHQAGGLAKLQSPTVDTVTSEFKTTDVVSPIAIMMMPTYNTKVVKSGDLPTSWTDFFTHFAKRKAVELTDWEWLATLVTKWFEAKKGMSESDALKLIDNGMKGATAVDGHTLVAQLLASGQYDYVPNLYAHYIPDLVKSGAPLSYAGITRNIPPMLITEFMGLTAGGKHPAGGLLLFEWMMSAEGQKVVDSQGYIAPSSTFKGTTLYDKYPYALVSTVWKETLTWQNKWKDDFDTLLQGVGSTKH